MLVLTPDIVVVGGRYGLGSKEFTPNMVLSVFENLTKDSPKPRFTVGIEDDVTHLSLPVGPWLNVLPEGTTECMFYGLGSDGTVGANKSAVKMIALGTELHAQAGPSLSVSLARSLSPFLSTSLCPFLPAVSISLLLSLKRSLFLVSHSLYFSLHFALALAFLCFRSLSHSLAHSQIRSLM